MQTQIYKSAITREILRKSLNLPDYVKIISMIYDFPCGAWILRFEVPVENNEEKDIQPHLIKDKMEWPDL